MQSDLQALQARHTSNGAGSRAGGPIKKDRDNIPAAPSQQSSVSCNQQQFQQQHGPLKPNNAKQSRKRTARSSSKASHNPRADNSSNWDGDSPKHASKKQQQAGTADRQGNDPLCSSNFHYIKVVGGGVKRPIDAAAGGPNNTVTTTNTSSSNAGNQTTVLPQPPSPKRTRQLSTDSSTSASAKPSSLQDYLDSLLSSRGYNPTKRLASELGYRRPPTPLQLASFGFAMCSTIRQGGANRLTALLGSGLSPNPTNKFGDSPFFMACKRGLYPLVKVFVENGADVRVADGFGRTPLHYVAWSNPPCLQSARLLLEADAKLLYVLDAHGKTPLDFVVEQHRSRWVEFIEDIKDDMWPSMSCGGRSNITTAYFPDAKEDGAGSSASIPRNALPVELAEKVASGHIMPEEAKRQMKLLATKQQVVQSQAQQ